MNKFFVTLFINNRVCQYKLDDLILNSFNGYVNESFVIGNKPIYLPIQISGDRYYIHSKISKWSIKYGNDTINEKHGILHGDYYVLSNGTFSYAALITAYSSFDIASKVYALVGNVFIGRSDDMNIVVDINANVPRKTAALHVDAAGKCIVEDLAGKIGIYVNGEKISSRELCNGDTIHIMGSTFVYFDNMLIVPSFLKTNGLSEIREFDVVEVIDGNAEKEYVRTPRILKSPDDGKIVIDPPTAPQKSKEMPFILTAGPSLTMSLAMLASLGVTVSNAISGGEFSSLITSGVMAISMLAGAVMWPGLLRKYNKRQEEANEKYRREKYLSYLSKKENEIRTKYERNTRILNEALMPSPETLVSFAADQNRRLWERGPDDEDFLNVRLGIGERPFGVEIEAPAKGFVLEDDAMIDSAISLAEKYRMLSDVPISISLYDKKVVGVVGDAVSIANSIITNIVSLHSYEEVKLILLYNQNDSKALHFANDLPHVWSSDKKQRYVATTKAEVQSLLSSLDEYILEREAVLDKDDKRLPYFVALVMDEKLVEGVPFRRHLVNAENNLGISTVFFGKHFNNIPKECTAIIQKDENICGIYMKNENDNRFVHFKADEVSKDLALKLAESVNRISVKAKRGVENVPDRVTFLDMYRVGNIGALEILNHWRTNISEKSLAAPIGIKSGGEVFSLDIHEKYHGCHGLVAGTTGSGKSEFLQAYILSMMINYSPNEVGFVLVDFKGGDMARPFLKSPHLAATISNLSGNTLHRALISLEAEVKSRQSIFNASAEQLGVDKIDINSYHRYFKDNKLNIPLPHLIIVIDEFAQLKSQHPEFMSKLIDIAQVGRSLGIHLILATQRPSGVVDPQIWSNSKFKVCLKVLDKQDSMDMINRAEAALIKQPGRAYVQVGYDEVFEQIQSGYSGADYIPQDDYVDEDSIAVKLVNWPAEQIRTAKKSLGAKKGSRTQLEEVVSFITEAGELQDLKVKKLWLPSLPLAIRLEECIKTSESFDKSAWDKSKFGTVVCGMVDLPEIQQQKPYGFDFVKNGHLAIYGSSGTGKSTLVQTIVYTHALKYSPEVFNLFVLDFDGGSLGGLAEMPHCVKYALGDDDSQVESVMNAVQSIISSRRELFAKAHCANYESYMASSGEKLPMIILALDNYAAFREKMYRSEDVLVQLISAARACGIYLVVTGNSKGAVYYKVIEQISEKIVLNMNDAGAYRDILNAPIPIEPENAKGRALAIVNKKAVEVQFAVPFDIENEAGRTAAIQNEYSKMNASCKRASFDFESALPEADNDATEAYIPIYTGSKMSSLDVLTSLSNSAVIGFDISNGIPQGFDCEAHKCIFIGDKGNQNAKLSIIDRVAKETSKSIYLVTSSTLNVSEKVNVVEDLDAFIETEAANTSRNDFILVIDGFCDFFDRISDEALSVFESILSGGISYNVITFDDMNRLDDYRDTGLYVKLVRAENGAVLGGAVDDTVAAMLTSQIYEIAKAHREKTLTDSQAFVYSNGKCAYVDVERG